jgi:hypothetical protein
VKKLFLIFVLCACSFFISSQTIENRGKFFSGIGVGYERYYNAILLPYEFACRNYSINFDWQILNNDNWLSITHLQLNYAPVFAKDMSIDIPIFNTNQHNLGAKFQYNLLRKINVFSKEKFNFFAGGNIDFQPEVELFLYQDIQKYFLRVDLSLGLSLFAEYDFGKIKLSDNFAMPLVVGSFYPHYSTVPFWSIGGAKNYFLVAPIGTLNRINNFFSLEIPIKSKGKLFTTLWLSYNFNYEFSIIRDNKIRTISHNGLAGFAFNICK